MAGGFLAVLSGILTSPLAGETPDGLVVERLVTERGDRFHARVDEASTLSVLEKVAEALGRELVIQGVDRQDLEETLISVVLDRVTAGDLVDLVCGAAGLSATLGEIQLQVRRDVPPGSALEEVAERAIWAYRRALVSFPRDDRVADAYLSLAGVFVRTGRWSEAEDGYASLVNLFPDDEDVPFALLQAARCSMEQQGYSGARTYAFEVVERHARSSEAIGACRIIVLSFIRQGRLDRARRCLDFFSARFDTLWEFADQELDLAMALFESGDVPAALDSLDRLLKCPDFHQEALDRLFLVRLECLVKLGRKDEAITTAITELRRSNPMLGGRKELLVLGDLYLLVDMPFFAYATGRHVQKTFTDEDSRRQGSALMVKGLVRLGLLAKAADILETEFEAVADSLTDNHEVLLQCAGYFLSLGDLEKAVGVYQKLVGHPPCERQAWLGMARVAHARGKYGDCVRLLEKYLGGTDGDLRRDACLLAADCFVSMGNDRAAVRALNGFLGETIP
jgi:tetratricopeptide (TPR) repeat protein